MKIISKETGVSLALVGTIVAVAVYITVGQASLEAKIQAQADESAAIKEEILKHELTDKEVLTDINTKHVTKTEIELGDKIIQTKLETMAKDVAEIKSDIREIKNSIKR